jgi:ABC-2 type transport system ATP-binding protein
MNVVQAEHVSKRYGRFLALDDCDISIPGESFTALVGANGAGKSTLLLMLVGLLRPTLGHLSVFGVAPHEKRREILARVGFVSQDRPLYGSLSVADTLEMGRRLNVHWDGKLAATRLVRLGIPLDKKVRLLSGGQQAQVSLSLALGKVPNLLILDEPMASLDPLARQLFLEEVVSVTRERQMTVIMSSHVIAELTRVCNYVVILQAGKIKVCGPVESAIAAWARRDQVARPQRLTDLEEAVLAYLSDGAPE